MLTAPERPTETVDDPPLPPPPRPRPRLGPERIAFLVLAAVVVVGVFANHWSEFVPDTKPELYLNPAGLVRTSLSSWAQNPYQGGTPNFNTGLAPVAAVIWLIEAPGTPPWLALRLWRAGLMLLAAWGAVRLYRRVAGLDGNAVGRVAVACAYVLNPFVIIGGGTTPILLPYALLPWLVLSFARSVEEPRSWRWPAVFALVFFAMSGMQAGVVPLFLLSSLPCYMLYRRIAHHDRWSNLFRSLFACGCATVAISLYWLIPSFLARNSGDAVAAESEDPQLIALTSSWAESLRLLGQWPMYGRVGDRLFLPKGIRYVADPLVVIASFAYPVLAALGAVLSRARARLLAVLFIAIALPVMVGMFPVTSPTLLGRFFAKAFADLPGAVAFRTTHKIAPVALLGFSLLIAFGAAALAPHVAKWPKPLTVGLAILTVLVIIGGTIPAWTNDLYRDGFSIPAYWKQAANDVNAAPPDQRLVVVPGAKGAQYRWGFRSPDDVFPSLFETPNVSRLTVSAGAIFPANYLAAMDIALNTGQAAGGTTSNMAYYLGGRDVLARNDTEWETVGGARPSVIQDQLRADPGLTPTATYGEAGTNTVRSSVGDGNPARAAQDAQIPPLTMYSVNGSVPITRAEPVEGHLVIDGDNFAVPILSEVGLMKDRPAFELAGSLTPAALEHAIDDGSHFVMTDTNRRRLFSVQRINDAYTPTLTADGSTSGQTATSATLWPLRPDTQTISTLVGAESITATRSGTQFGLSAYGGPEQAFDGDTKSAWIASSFGGGQGESITVNYVGEQRPRSVTIQTIPSRPVAISAISVSTNVSSTVVPVNADGKVTVDLPAEPTSSITVGIARLRGSGTNVVGISEISIDGVHPETVMVMPKTLAQMAASLPQDKRDAMARLPLDIVMKRQTSTPGDAGHDEERSINRVFTTPTDRTFVAAATLTGGEDLGADTKAELFAAGQPEGDPCVRVGELDGKPLEMKLTTALDQALDSKGGLLVSCQELPLAAGEHTFTSDVGWTPDIVRFATPDAKAATPQPAPTVDVRARSNTEVAAHVSNATGPFFLVAGSGFDRRWVGTIDGKPLGEPILIDGYATGWRVDAPGDHDVQFRFFPQRLMDVGIGLSVIAFLACVLVAVLPARWRPRRRRRPTPKGAA